MASNISQFRPLSSVAIAVATVAFWIAAPLGGAPQQQTAIPASTAPATDAAASPAQKKYVGSETCQTCHEDIYKAFQRNAHAGVDTQKRLGFEKNACESCHGPGSVHAESVAPADILNPAKLPAAQTDRTCLKCHLNQSTHVGTIRSGHAKNQVSCAQCHSVHKGAEALRAHNAADINAKCATCHQSAWAQFQRPYKHPLSENAMSCVDCHNPHGSIRPRSIQTVAANEPGCFKCHTDKRGPFTYPHAPMRTDTCWSCHEPHGSSNPRMLTRAEVRFTCLECHANTPPAIQKASNLGGVPPAFHDLTNPRFRNCTICHVKIHGSHVDRNFTR